MCGKIVLNMYTLRNRKLKKKRYLRDTLYILTEMKEHELVYFHTQKKNNCNVVYAILCCFML